MHKARSLFYKWTGNRKIKRGIVRSKSSIGWPVTHRSLTTLASSQLPAGRQLSGAVHGRERLFYDEDYFQTILARSCHSTSHNVSARMHDSLSLWIIVAYLMLCVLLMFARARRVVDLHWHSSETELQTLKSEFENDSAENSMIHILECSF